MQVEAMTEMFLTMWVDANLTFSVLRAGFHFDSCTVVLTIEAGAFCLSLQVKFRETVSEVTVTVTDAHDSQGKVNPSGSLY